MPVTTIPDGKHVCAVDEPSNVMTLMGVGGFADEAQCAMQCTGDGGCQGFNLKTLLCEMYSYIPSRLALVSGCSYRQVSTKSQATYSVKSVLKISMCLVLNTKIKLIAEVVNYVCLCSCIAMCGNVYFCCVLLLLCFHMFALI